MASSIIPGWQNFIKVIRRAKEACSNVGQDVLDHFIDVNKMIELGSGAIREISILSSRTIRVKNIKIIQNPGIHFNKLCLSLHIENILSQDK